MNESPRIARKALRSCSTFWLMCAGVLGAVMPSAVFAQQTSSTVYVRVDSDRTTVITPRVSVQAPVDDSTKLDVAYSMDIWSSASIDIRTSASRPVTERRDELNASVTHDFSDSSLSLGYRYSYEPDYESHFVSLGLTFDFADKASTLTIGGGVSFDDVGRVGSPYFSRSLHTYTGQLTFTQVLDTKSLLQAVYSVGYYDGYQSSPYRFVGIGTPDGACPVPIPPAPSLGTPAVAPQPGAVATNTIADRCLPENNPSERLRHAFVLTVGRALSDSLSVRGTYRFYIDDWEIISHTVLAELNWLADLDTMFGLRYRFYLQSAAAQYRPRFPSPFTENGVLNTFYSRDKELSPFNAHRLSLEFDKTWPLPGVGEKLQTVVSIGPTLYLYDNFIPFKRIIAFEATVSGVLVL